MAEITFILQRSVYIVEFNLMKLSVVKWFQFNVTHTSHIASTYVFNILQPIRRIISHQLIKNDTSRTESLTTHCL